MPGFIKRKVEMLVSRHIENGNIVNPSSISCSCVCSHILEDLKNAWSNHPSSGLPLPYLSHYPPCQLYMWDLYKKFSCKGLLFTKVFNFNSLVGDFNTFKYIFTHPDIQDRTGSNFHTDTVIRMIKEELGIPAGPLEGLIYSQGKVWAEQSRFTFETLWDFGFRKSGRILYIVNKRYCTKLNILKYRKNLPNP